jgi:hypothetical protein
MKTSFTIIKSVKRKYITEEFSNRIYFDRTKEFGYYTVSFTLLPDRKTMIAIHKSILDYGKRLIPSKIIILVE